MGPVAVGIPTMQNQLDFTCPWQYSLVSLCTSSLLSYLVAYCYSTLLCFRLIIVSIMASTAASIFLSEENDSAQSDDEKREGENTANMVTSDHISVQVKDVSE